MDSIQMPPATRSAALSTLTQVGTMAAIVATLVYVPLVGATVLVLRLCGISLESALTFGGAVHAALGLLICWSICLVGSCAYAAWIFPWGDWRRPWRGAG